MKTSILLDSGDSFYFRETELRKKYLTKEDRQVVTAERLGAHANLLQHKSPVLVTVRQQCLEEWVRVTNT